jgi:hypothetical protein
VTSWRGARVLHSAAACSRVQTPADCVGRVGLRLSGTLKPLIERPQIAMGLRVSERTNLLEKTLRRDPAIENLCHKGGVVKQEAARKRRGSKFLKAVSIFAWQKCDGPFLGRLFFVGACGKATARCGRKATNPVLGFPAQ